MDVLFGILVYILDVTTDVIVSYEHFMAGHPIWGGCTAAFIALPLLLGNGVVITVAIKGKVEYSRMSLLLRVLVVCGGIVCPPLIPLGYLVSSLVTAVRKYPGITTYYTSKATGGTALLKLFEAVFEALPQASFQMYIVGQGLVGIGDAPGTCQYIAIVTSLVSLAWSIVNYKLVDATISTKAALFTSVLMITSSRLLVATILSMHTKGFFWLPLACELALYITALITALITCRYCYLPKTVLLVILVTGTTINISCGIIGVCLSVPQAFAITAMSVAAATPVIVGSCFWYLNKN
ncbi:unnamed protein product [Meganyctiphanes norvegica]|uniref:XK-related protein n=1 Tax=Meganyctiphanes norvegica TaxID=48144 RepID=A0AAV2SCB0_MEGNR